MTESSPPATRNMYSRVAVIASACGVITIAIGCWVALTTGMPSDYAGGFSDSVNYLRMADFFALGPGVDAAADLYARTSRFPPAYPAVLGLAGGGAQDIARAHWIQAAIAVFALIALIALYRRALKHWAPALVLGGAASSLAWFIPNAFEISSEAMFLGLAAAAFAVACGPATERVRYTVLAVVLALSVLTRVVGVLLLPGLALWAWRRERRLGPVLWILVAPVLPLLLWTAYRAAGPPGADYIATTIRHIFLQYSHPIDFVATQAAFVADGLSGRIGGGPLSMIAAVCVVIGAVLGLARGVRANQPLAMGVVVYVLAVLLQPFPAESSRFLSIALPLLLPLVVLGFSSLGRGSRETEAPAPRLMVAMIVLAVSLQGGALALLRTRLPMDPALDPYRRALGFYVSENGAAYAEVMHRQRMLLDAARAEVPEGECMYAVHRSLPELYSTIRTVDPAIPLIDPETKQLNGLPCRFAYVVNLAIVQRGAEPLYPASRYPSLFEPLLVSMLEPSAGSPPSPAVALLRFKGEVWKAWFDDAPGIRISSPDARAADGDSQ